MLVKDVVLQHQHDHDYGHDHWSRWSEECCLDHPAHTPEKVRPVRRISDRVIRRYSKLTSMLSFRGGTEIYDDYIIFWLSSYSWPPPFIYIGFRLDHSLMLCICFCFCKAPYLKKNGCFWFAFADHSLVSIWYSWAIFPHHIINVKK